MCDQRNGAVTTRRQGGLRRLGLTKCFWYLFVGMYVFENYGFHGIKECFFVSIYGDVCFWKIWEPWKIGLLRAVIIAMLVCGILYFRQDSGLLLGYFLYSEHHMKMVKFGTNSEHFQIFKNHFSTFSNFSTKTQFCFQAERFTKYKIQNIFWI